jgi:hypothetical protein
LQLAQDYQASYVLTLNEGRLPSLGQDFQQLLPLCPENRLLVQQPHGLVQEYRWVEGLPYRDSAQRHGTFTALPCLERTATQTKRFAWITELNVTPATVQEVACKGGRERGCIENEG